MGADLGLGVSADAGVGLGNFWKSKVQVRRDMFTNKLLNIFIYMLLNIFSYNGKYIPI